MEQEDEREFVALAKEIIKKCNLNTRVEKITDCKDDFFVLLYQGLIGDNLKGLISNPVNQDEHTHNCQCVIDSLANDVLNVDLSHISAKGIVSGDVLSIRNLLEIFSGLLEYFVECIDENESDFEDDLDDSNVLTSEHDVISSLLKEEFGSSYQVESRKGNNTAALGKQRSSGTDKATMPLSLYSTTNQRTCASRMLTDPSIRHSSFTGSGHEADSSEVSDSTNELIRLGESSSSGNSSVRRAVPIKKSLVKQKETPKTTWQQSALFDNGNHEELTQYTISSDEGEKDSSTALDNKNHSTDHLSSSLLSSTSSWRQQISPLDADDNGVKLDTIGLRPKVDHLTTAGKDSSEEGGSSGRSTPILHHHYHHHFHHPTDSKIPRKANDTSSHYDKIQDYRDIPGNIKTSAQVSSAILPGQSTSGMLRATMPEYIPGQLTRTELPGTSVYASRGTGLPGRGIGSSGFSSYSREAVSLPSNDHGIPNVLDHSRSTNILPQYTTSGSGLTGQGHIGQRIPVTDYSRSSVPAQHVRSDASSTVLPDYTSSRPGNRWITGDTSSRALPEYTMPGLAGQSHTLPGTSRLETSGTGQSATTTRTSFPEQSHSGLPGMLPYQSRLKTGLQGERPMTNVSTTAARTTLPGQSYTGVQRMPHSENFKLRTSLQGERTIMRTNAPASYVTTQPGQTSHGLSLSDSSQLRDPSVSSAPGRRPLHEQYLSRGTSLATTTSFPSTSGLLTVSSGGYSDVFTSTNTDMDKKYIPASKSMETRQPRESKELQRTLETDKHLVSTTSKDVYQPNALPSAVQTGARQDENVESVDSDLESDDDSDAARYSDSAIDYNRGGEQVDSDNETSEDSILRRIHDRWKRLKTSQSAKPAAQRAVTFNDDIQTIPITSRMDRLRRLLDDEAEEQQHQTASIRDVYAEQLQDIQKQQQRERKEIKKRKVQKSPLVPKKKAKKTVPSKQRGRLEAIYRPQGRPGRPTKRHPVKTRKRSASASPDIGRRRKNTLADFHETLLPSLFEEFPFLHVSPQATRAMWQKQARQVSLLSKSETAALKTKGQRRVEEAEKRQEQLLKILRKELEHNQRMSGERERQDHQRTIKAKVNEKRQVAARARRYYDEYQLRMRAKMLKRRTREEQILKRLFDDGLEIQKQRVRELRKYAKDKTEVIEQKQSNEIESLENYYKDQFSILAEDMTRERREMKVRQQAQEKVMRQMRRELRKKMEKEIEDLQETLTRDEDSAYFRQLEADRIRREFQLAMYKSDL